ncbi:MAG: Clp protease N-terminal domain-containing protein, partial [Acetobacteraceae bacterium]
MAAIDLKSLVGHLNDHCRRALEAAAGLTLSRSHYNVEIEHWLLKLADGTDTDIAAILRHYEADVGRLITDLNRGLDRLKTGNARAPGLSPDIVELAKQAWLLASLEQGFARIRSGHLLWALLADETLAQRGRAASSQLLKISPDLLKRDFLAVTAGSSEAAAPPAADGQGGPVEPGMARPAGSAALDQFTIDLTARA